MKQRFSWLLVLLLAWATPASAHNVLGTVYAVGNEIEGEAGFSNGDMAAEGTLVEVLSSAGEKLGETRIDSEGLFVFTASRRIDHHFRIDMSSGHVVEMMLPAGELPVHLASSTGSASGQAALAPSAAITTSSVDAQQLSQLVEAAVAKQVVPLRKELAAFKEKAGLQQVLGGIGYIFGLCGIAIVLRQRYLSRVD